MSTITNPLESPSTLKDPLAQDPVTPAEDPSEEGEGAIEVSQGLNNHHEEDPLALSSADLKEDPSTRLVKSEVITPNLSPMKEGPNKADEHAQIQQKFQDVRVDNWGNYCLQRLQGMYERGDFCDLTLQFHTNQLIKVHRVVVNVCTEYFANLERLFGLSDGVLVLPKDIDYQAIVTIVKFMYTGKLEIRGNIFNEVYKTVKLMNITILIKLLEAHSKKPSLPLKKDNMTRPMGFKQSLDVGKPKAQLSPGGGVQLTGTPVKIGGTTALSIQGAGGTRTLQVTSPGVKLPPGVRTKTVLARVQPQGMRITHGHGMNKVISQKKLPIWKERRKFESVIADRWPPKEELARPTRFEWGDPDEDPFGLSTPGPIMTNSFSEKPKPPNPANSRKIEDIFDAVKSQTLGKRNAHHTSISPCKSPEPPSKIGKMSASSPTDDVMMGGPPTLHDENDDVNLTDETVEEEVSTTEAPATFKKTSILKPALKTSSSRLTPMVGNNDPNFGAVGSKAQLPHTKSVRFAPEVEKENSKAEEHHAEVSVPIEEDIASSHSKIIAEVLKKYPDLVKDKQNIKLKIVQRGSQETTSVKDKTKVSYIVLKSTSGSSESMGAVLLKKPAPSVNRAFWDQAEKEKKPSGAENTTGPWLCSTCGGGEETPMEFESYYVYRKHLVDVHGERIDARICEYCGQKASKRNLLLYHLYTKHGVSPPPNVLFPNCDRCDYIALSESLLNKHKLTHDAAKEFSCHICNASFKTNGALQGHMAANLHRNKETKVYECPYCRKPFVRNINLKGHIRALHRDIARIEEMEDPRLPHDETLLNRPGVSFTGRKRQFPSILGSRSVPLEIIPGDGSHGQQVSLVTADGHTIEILHGLDPNSMSVPVTLVPSSEAEAMTSVASSIAASLGLDQGVHGEYISGVTGDQAVYIVDNSQPAVEVDMSAMALTSDGSMIYEGEDPTAPGQFIVQDIHGNQFRKMTGIDETGKQVIFFQLSDEHGPMAMTPNVLEDGMQTTTESSSVFVSSDMTVPVNTISDSTSQQAGHESTIYDLDQESHGQVIIGTTPISESEERQQDFQHQHDIKVSQEQLQIVLEHNETETVEQEQDVEHQEEPMTVDGSSQDASETEERGDENTVVFVEEEVSACDQEEAGNTETPISEQETQVVDAVTVTVTPQHDGDAVVTEETMQLVEEEVVVNEN